MCSIFRAAAFLLLCIICHYAHAQATKVTTTERTIPFDTNWKFFRGDVIQGEAINFNDATWRNIELPHDWSIEDLPAQGDSIIGPFSKASVGGSSTGFTVGGTGWYRKTFTLDKIASQKVVSIYFDGVYMNSDVWINGHHLGNHPYGYTPFYYDLTPYLKYNGVNVLAVKVRNIGKNTRWYTGSGIYRHVSLIVTDPIHVNPSTTFITTPEVSNQKAVINIKATIENTSASEAKVTVRTRILNSNLKSVGNHSTDNSIQKNKDQNIDHTIEVINPLLWSPKNPALYTVAIEVVVNNEIIDHVAIPIGIRSISFSAEKGFLLNEEKVLLKGACLHHDNGILGAKAIARADERKIELMKANGFNAIRCSHNPPSQTFLDACDRLGMLVIDEAFDMWEHPKNPDDYHLYFNEWWQHDLDAMLLRDRNHPSIIMWSIGNEIYERAASSGLTITKKLVEEVHRHDNTRPVIEALCTFWEHPTMKWKDADAAFSLLDAGGYNYEWRNYESDHQRHPKRIMIGTESLPREAYESWQQVERYPFVIGDFVWTGMDYVGEAGIGHTVPDSVQDSPLMPWPWFNGFCGDFDLIGNKKPQSYYRDVLWNRKKVAMAVHAPLGNQGEKISKWGWPDEQQRWTWPSHEGEILQVNVYTRSAVVRLSCNGKTVGTKVLTDSSKLTAQFSVPYSVGELKAVVLDKQGREVDSVIFYTTGKAAALRLEPDRSAITTSRDDLAYIMVSLVDDKGNVVTNEDAEVTFKVSGQGELLAVGNAHPYEVQSFQQARCKTYRAKCLVILRPNGIEGTMKLHARANDFPEVAVTVQCVKK
jgi:beta-galactosidase